MLKNYFVIALRNLWRNKLFASVNILGLSLGLACSLLIFLWVKDEYSIDAWHTNRDQLYAVYERVIMDDHVQAGYYTPGPLGAELVRTVPEVERAVTVRVDGDPRAFAANGKTLKERGNYAGEDFFIAFSYPLLAGDRATVLKAPGGIVLSGSMARGLFGSVEAAMGKTVRMENRSDYRVTGVFADLPRHASSPFDYLISWATYQRENAWAGRWDNYSPRTYVLLRPGASAAVVEGKIKDFLNAYNKELNEHLRVELGLQRFDQVYLHSDFKDGYIAGGRIEQVRLFSIVAIVVLLIACINFMNLTTALSIRRAKEIGVRKVAGAPRSALIRQFIGEAVLLVAVAAVLALVVVRLVLPVYNVFTDKDILLPFGSVAFWGEVVALVLVTGLLAGCYPALYLSSFDPVRVLKGVLSSGRGGSLWLRKALVVFQFVLSITLIVGAIVVSQQVRYIQTKNIGYERDNLVYIPLEGNLPAEYPLLKREALRLPGVVDVTRMGTVPTLIENYSLGVDWDGKDPAVKPVVTFVTAGYDFVRTMRLSLVLGRDFSPAFATDSVGCLINETALSKIGYSDPIGKPLRIGTTRGTIIGVLKDFHFNSLHEPIQPLLVTLGERESGGTLLVRVAPVGGSGGVGTAKQALAGLDALCRRLNPAFPFTYRFADEEYRHLYRSEQVVETLADVFALLAVVISCLGLLGLALFTAQQRTKEIGIRKVLGASAGSVFRLLSKEFLGLVFVALVIAAPLAWWAMNRWLEDFAYRIDIRWTVVAAAGLVTMGIALVTVSVQAVRAARANPVKSLRAE